MTSDEEDFASLPVINVTSVNARGAGVDDDAGTSADGVTVLHAQSGIAAAHGLMKNRVNRSLIIKPLADAQLAESGVNTDKEGELLRSETTLEEVNDDPQPTSSQTFRRDSNAMGLVISDSISLQESMTLLHTCTRRYRSISMTDARRTLEMNLTELRIFSRRSPPLPARDKSPRLLRLWTLAEIEIHFVVRMTP